MRMEHYVPARLVRLQVVASLLVLLLLSLGGCSPKDRENAQGLATTGAATSKTLAEYYESLADMTERRPALEVIYASVQKPAQPNPPSAAAVKSMERQGRGLRARAAMARQMEAMYGAMANLSAYDAPAAMSKSVDGLIANIETIRAEKLVTSPPGTPLVLGLKAATDTLVRIKQSRNLRQAARDTVPVLQGIAKLVCDEGEKAAYKEATEKYFTTLVGNSATAEPTTDTIGIVEHLMGTRSMTIQFLVQDIPELKSLPWSQQGFRENDHAEPGPVEKAMQKKLLEDLGEAKKRALASPDALGKSLDGLTLQHQKFLARQPLTLATVNSFREPAQAYLDLWKRLRGKD